VSPRFERDDVDEVRARADIVEVIGDHVRLRRVGTDWTGLCPFHQEKTPSFRVNPSKGVYYCHGCHEGGSVFTFLEKIEGLAFGEAVESLAQRYGIELRESKGMRKGPSPRQRLYTLQEKAVARYREWLAATDAEPVRAYLESRGITPELIEKYQIGFGGWRRDALVRAALRNGFTNEELMAAGLASRDAGGVRDTFAGRVLFPIFDASGRPVGFGGRVLPEEHRAGEAPDAPKYLNSRESPIFKKSRILYGTNWARVDVMQRKRLVIVEGYTDVIALQASGIGESVATCGTSLTEDHMKEISTRFGDVRVVLCLDSDAAGQAAMSRERTEELAGQFSPGNEDAAGAWLPVGRGWLPEVNVANLPQGKDPADFVRAEGPDEVSRVLDRAVPLIEFLLRRALDGADFKTPDGRARAIRRGVDVLKQVGDPLMRHEYVLWLADRGGVDAYEINKALEAAIENAPKRRGPIGPAIQAPVALSGAHRIEREALRGILSFPVLFADDVIAPNDDDFTLPLHRSVFRLISTEWTESGEIDVARMASRVQEEELRRVLSELSVGTAPAANVARDTLVRVRVATLERHIVERKSRLRALDPDRDAAAYDALFEELLGLEKHKRSLSTG
jgi:DNA primase